MKQQLQKIALFFFLFNSVCYSQVDTIKKTSKFTISSVDFKIYPIDNYLFLGQNNHVRISPTIKGVKFSCKVTNGEIIMQKDSTYIIKNNLPVNTLLSIYTKDVNGKEHLAVTKAYVFVPFPSVKIFSVKSDSSITRMMLASGNFYAEFKGIGKIPIKSFKMEMTINNAIVQDSSSNGKLNKKMLQYLSTLKPGELLYFTDLKYTTSDGKLKTEPIYRVFLIKDEPNPMQFGF